MNTALRLALATFLGLLWLDSLAAGVTIETRVEATFQASTNALCTTSTAGLNCERAAGLLSGTGTAADAALHFEYFSSNETGLVPNFTFEGTASASATAGSLHASTSVQIIGFGPTAGSTTSPPTGINGRAQVFANDIIHVQSNSLAVGTPVTINVLFQVHGNGPGEMDLNVGGLFSGKDVAQFGLNSQGEFDALSDISGSFTALVGDALKIVYSLSAQTIASSNGWRAIDTVNGRATASSYANTANLYFSLGDASLPVQLLSDTGHDYSLPNAVPVPASAWMMVSALSLIGACRRRNSHAAHPAAGGTGMAIVA